MASRKWVVRSLVFAVSAVLALALFAYGHWTSPAVIREKLLAGFEEHLAAGAIRVESARLKLLEGISFNDMRFTRKDDPGKTEFLLVPSGTIYHDKEQLAHGVLAIRKIEFDKPTVRVIRQKDGTWNMAGVLSPPDPNEPVPTIELKQATLLFEDRIASPNTPPLQVKDLHLTILNDPISLLNFEGTGSADLIGTVRVTGSWDRRSGVFKIVLSVPNFAIDGALVQRVAAYQPEVAVHARQLSGIGKLQAEFTYKPEATQPWSHDLRAQLAQGKFRHARLPLPLESIEARIRCLDGQIALEAPLTARSGPAQLRVTRLALSASGSTDLDASAEVEHLPLSPELFAALPAPLHEIQHDYNPRGRAGVALEYHRHGGQVAEHCIIRPEQATVRCARFPYELALIGTIEHESNPAQAIERYKVDLVGYTGARPVIIRGSADGQEHAAVDFKILAHDVPIDAKLRGALFVTRPDLQRLIESFHPAGLVDVEVALRRPAGKTQFANQYTIHFHDASLLYDIFPYPVENVSGTLDILPERWEFRDFVGTHKGGQLSCSGGSSPTAQGNRVTVSIAGTHVLLDQELEKALQPHPEVRTAWKKLSPSGRIHFKAQVDQLPGKRDPVLDVTVWPRGCTIVPEFFAYELTNLYGTIHYHDHLVEVDKLRARHGPTILTVEAGKVLLRPGGGLSVDLVKLAGAPVVPDTELYRALPPALGKACAALRLKDPLGLWAEQLTIAVPAEAQSPPHIYWNGGIRLANASVYAGVELTKVNGVLWCRGEHLGSFRGVAGNLELDEATILGQPFRKIVSQIRISPDKPELVLLPNLQGQIFSGDVAGAAWIQFGPTLVYDLYLKASQVQLEEAGRFNHLDTEAKMSGLVAAALHLHGQGSELSGLVGEGAIDVPTGKMHNFPILLDLLKVFNGRWPDKTAFEEAHAHFSIQGPRVTVTRFDLFGNAVSLGGRGTLNLDGTDVQLDFYSVLGRLQQSLPVVLDQIPPLLGKSLLKIKMRGRIGQLEVTKEPVPLLVEPVKELLKRVSGRQPSKG